MMIMMMVFTGFFYVSLLVSYDVFKIPFQSEDSQNADDFSGTKRKLLPDTGRGKWDESIPNSIILMRGLPSEATDNDVSFFCHFIHWFQFPIGGLVDFWSTVARADLCFSNQLAAIENV